MNALNLRSLAGAARRRASVVLLLVWTTALTWAGPGSDLGPETVIVQAAERSVLLSGFTRARAQVPLVAEQAGRVEAVFGDIGDALDDRGRFAQLDATFVRLDLDEIGVQQERLRSRIAFDRSEVTRYRELARAKNTSVSELDALEQSLRDNTHALAELDVKRRIAEERLARMRIHGPAGWRITGRGVEPGQWVSVGETVGHAEDFSTLLVPFALTPRELAALESAGTALQLELTDLSRQLPARIHRINPGFDPETRKIAVELTLTEPPPERRGGLRAGLELRLPESSGAVRLPSEAVASSYDEYWVMRPGGERLPVLMLGPDPLHPGQVRVVSPALRVGDAVRLPPGV
ncbi:efflux RND transporter periplasmic adaptor subunit [Thiocystis violacea]|uniref:efflux RND transporter periplasmic adaptor subunit n=1 Tax=Thiocystis violacea TaxID=13725 RepID=UPI001908F1E3|nr:HlyD family efflux transporter periplasmic adaptor subunit [Thiocystis violacea]MBK1723508.1 efflux transporter periplasmic adaptor subunit [Thiocystis violacea]